MKYEVYCSLNIEDFIEIKAKDEEDARIKAKLLFSENIPIDPRHWKEVDSEVVCL